MNEIKTYKDSYLFNFKTSKMANNADKSRKALSEFVSKSTRIDKSSPAFAGIIEDIKRQQTTSIIHTVLLMENVELCINSYELPRSFKVFEGIDIKSPDRPIKVFIDVTGIIEYKNKFFVCRSVDKLITYIYDALTYLLYRYANTRLMNNNEIVTNATACYTKMFCYIIDYLGTLGFKENKSKISYCVALFFLSNLMSKEIEPYTKSIAAKVSDVPAHSIGAYDLYLKDIDFTNIDTFIITLSKEFGLRRSRTETLDLAVLLNKWVFSYGTGTEYGLDLFTSFSIMLNSAFIGAYVINQKQVERTCSLEMVKYNNAFKTIAADTFESRMYRENREVHDKNTVELAEAMKERLYGVAPKFTGKEFKSIEEVMDLSKALKKYYVDTRQTEKIPKEVIKVVKMALPVMESYIEEGTEVYQEGNLLKFCKVYKNIFNGDNLRKIEQLIDDHIRIYQGIAEDTEIVDTKKRACRCISELREVKQYL